MKLFMARRTNISMYYSFLVVGLLCILYRWLSCLRLRIDL